MRKSHLAADTISSELRRIAEISQAAFGSEDDLIHKIILPFFQVIGYGADSFELKLPVKAYRPNRRGSKPEADCVFFSSSTHDLSSSLLVAEIKRDDQESRSNRQDFILRTFSCRFTFRGAAWDLKCGRCKTFGRLRLLAATGSTRLIVQVSLS